LSDDTVVTFSGRITLNMRSAKTRHGHAISLRRACSTAETLIINGNAVARVGFKLAYWNAFEISRLASIIIIATVIPGSG
jgi:hypothetical protein